MPPVKIFFTDEQQQEIIKAIGNAEACTSGEIKIHVEEKCGDDVLKRAREIFSRLKMGETVLKNGVLIYIATKDKKFAIIGDVGIDSLVPDNFWNDIKERMQFEFSNGNFVGGILFAVEQAGEKLKTYFPSVDDINELSDEISFSND